VRTVRTQRSAYAFALGARGGVFTTSMLAAVKTRRPGDLWACPFRVSGHSLDREVQGDEVESDARGPAGGDGAGSGCLPRQPNNVAHVDAQRIAGFWLGLGHSSLFNHHVNIYDCDHHHPRRGQRRVRCTACGESRTTRG
jgi:hypothetical protein